MENRKKARIHESPILNRIIDRIPISEMKKTKSKLLLAARIEDLMINKGWNKGQFAEQVGKQQSEITKWLSGTHNFTVDTLIEIVHAFNLQLEDLFPSRINLVAVFKGSLIVGSEIGINQPIYGEPKELNRPLWNKSKNRDIAFTYNDN